MIDCSLPAIPPPLSEEEVPCRAPAAAADGRDAGSGAEACVPVPGGCQCQNASSTIALICTICRQHEWAAKSADYSQYNKLTSQEYCNNVQDDKGMLSTGARALGWQEEFSKDGIGMAPRGSIV